VEVCKKIGGTMSKFILLGMDTCTRNLKAFDMLSSRIDTQHMLMVPCEFHGLQLFIKDVLEKNTNY
jgi:hypothetical protein